MDNTQNDTVWGSASPGFNGLPGYAVFSERVHLLIEADPEGASRGDYAIVLFDIQRFKAVNDLFGREAGDRLLSHIAATTKEYVDTGVACRLSGDCFVAFVHEPYGDESLYSRTLQLFDDISRFTLPCEILLNAGLYRTTAERLSVSDMIDRARIAQQTVKGSYNNKFALYTDAMREAVLREQMLTGHMAKALEAGELCAMFQPIYNHKTGELVAAEALARWQHPELGELFPGEFLPLFEKNGFISQLDRFIFREACALQKLCFEHGLQRVPVSVNLSMQDLAKPSFTRNLINLRKSYGIPADLLRLEISESAMSGKLPQAKEALSGLKAAGFTVEIDDFGRGTSSLNTLKDIDMDILKLDMSFLHDANDDSRGELILPVLMHVADLLGFSVIAEGVETAEQADRMQDIGCEIVQGFLYSQPMSKDDFIALLKKGPAEKSVS